MRGFDETACQAEFAKWAEEHRTAALRLYYQYPSLRTSIDAARDGWIAASKLQHDCIVKLEAEFQQSRNLQLQSEDRLRAEIDRLRRAEKRQKTVSLILFYGSAVLIGWLGVRWIL